MSILFGNSTNVNNSIYSGGVNTSQEITHLKDNNISLNLQAGGTLSGEVVSKDGNVVTLKLSNNQTISAKLEGNSDISVGKQMTFEIAKGSSNQTLLRPLFSNLDASPAVNAALKAAGLPLTNNNISFTSQMMNEGMAVNKNALLDMAKIVSSHPSANPATVVSLHNIGMDITDTNINQYNNYQSFKHQIMSDVINMADGLSNMLSETTSDLPSLQFAADILDVVFSEENSNLNNNDLSNNILSNNTNISGMALDSLGQEALAGGEALNSDTFIANPENISFNPAQTNNEGQVINQSTSSMVDNMPKEEMILDINSITRLIDDDKNTYQNDQYSNNLVGQQEGLINTSDNSNSVLSNDNRMALLEDINSILDMSNKGHIDANASDSQIISSVRDLINEYIASANEENITNTDSKVDAGITNSATNTNGTSNINVSGGQANSINNDQTVTSNNQADESGKTKLLNNLNLMDKLKILENEEPYKDNSNIKNNILHKLVDLTKSDRFTKLVNETVKNQMSLSPSEIKNGKIEELYERISRQSTRIAELMANNDKADSLVAKSATNIGDNVKFMNNLNEFMNYVQLPLKMAGENAHGDLYVYTKKKNLKENDGNFSALLHLDMDHLGPMDIHVNMREYTKVNTYFYLQNEEMLDFIEEHIDELTQRLVEKGYNATVNASKSSNKEAKPISTEFGKEDFNPEREVSNNGMKLCFDVRA